MSITRESVEQRLKQLLEEESQIMTLLSATRGAVEDCKFWLTQFDQEDPKEEDKHAERDSKSKSS